MKHYLSLAIFTLLTVACAQAATDQSMPLYFCAAASENYYHGLLNLIGSLHNTNFDQTIEIAVFDLGMSAEQLEHLRSIEKVRIYDVERTNPDILTPFVSRPNGGKTGARGWYSWKPVVIKQALDMFPYVLYLDAGLIVLHDVTPVFKYIQKEGFFARDEFHNIAYTTTRYVMEKFHLLTQERSWVLFTHSIHSAAVGLSRKIYDSFVLPLYHMSKDIRYFQDDGSAPGGFGWARHDQTLFSIVARLLHFKTFESSFSINGKEYYIAGSLECFNKANNDYDLKEKMIWAHTRTEIDTSFCQQYIRYKESKIL
jgi:hypothetical protein